MLSNLFRFSRSSSLLSGFMSLLGGQRGKSVSLGLLLESGIVLGLSSCPFSIKFLLASFGGSLSGRDFGL